MSKLDTTDIAYIAGALALIVVSIPGILLLGVSVPT